jgi:hypothetical protein
MHMREGAEERPEWPAWTAGRGALGASRQGRNTRSAIREPKEKDMRLYHGSNLIVPQPRLINQTRGLDFGAGFHLTTSEDQARRFSEIVVTRRKTGSPCVSVYDFDIGSAERNLRIRRFNDAGAEWLRFVADNRLKKYSGEEYDAVIGAVADDAVMPTIQAFLGGFIGEEAALVALKSGKLVDQVCLKTENALALLKFERGCIHGGDAHV